MIRLKRLKIVVLALCLLSLSAVTAHGGTCYVTRAAIRTTARVEYPLGITSRDISDYSSEKNTDSKNPDSPQMFLFAGTGGAQITMASDCNLYEIIIFPNEISEDTSSVFSGGKISKLTLEKIMRNLPAHTRRCTLTVIRAAD